MGHHHHPPKTFNKAFAISISLNLSFTIIEAIYAIIANSMGLLADAGHNLGDVLGLLLAWGASWLLTKPATERYSYGYKRTTILAAIANALLLVVTSALIAYESFHKLMHPVIVQENIIITVAAIGIFINGGTALLFMRGRKADLNIKGAFLHLAFDTFISLGVVIAGVIILFSGWYWLDPVVGLLIVVTILLGTWALLRDSVKLLLDAVPHGIQHSVVKDYLKNLSGVVAVHDLHIWGLSTKEVALTAHLVMPTGELTDSERLAVNKNLREQFNINHVTIQVEKGSKQHPCEHENVCQ